jgi:hypothetical protein
MKTATVEISITAALHRQGDGKPFPCAALMYPGKAARFAAL